MSELVIVTTWNREELLYLCLEAIRAQDDEIPIRVYSDRDASTPDLLQACDAFHASVTVRGPHRFFGNSYNTLHAFGAAVFDPNVKIVHSIEDDTIIHRGYLNWARKMLAAGGLACVTGRRAECPNWYESPCASWNADQLREALGHIIPEYFQESREAMVKVLDSKMFPKSRYLRGGGEQDGFFLRCIEHHQWKTAYPPMWLASHIGWFGYNRPPGHERPPGTFEQRIAAARELWNDLDRREKLFGQRIARAEWEGRGGI
jgi:glycosyltransferase involved in cell wall biosynthesis